MPWRAQHSANSYLEIVQDTYSYPEDWNRERNTKEKWWFSSSLFRIYFFKRNSSKQYIKSMKTKWHIINLRDLKHFSWAFLGIKNPILDF